MPFSWKVGLSIRKSVASCATAGYILTVPDGKQYLEDFWSENTSDSIHTVHDHLLTYFSFLYCVD